MNTPFAIDVTDLNKHFANKHVVRNLNLQVRSGEIFGFLGPNGSGKTTSIRMLCGLLTPDSGQGTCLGFDVISESAAIKSHVGYMTQKFSLWNDLSIRENLDFVARMFSMQNRRQIVSQTLEELGLSSRKNQLAGTLSGGWKQRLALACCLLHKPKLLLLDEPTAGVDPQARRDFWEEIHRLSDQGVTVLVSTHYMDEAERCHRLAYLAYGNLLTRGTVGEVVRAANLTTWTVAGPHLHRIARELRGRDGVEQVAAFGNTLHVSGRDAARLDATIAAATDAEHTWTRGSASLEDVFIGLMETARDNFA